MEKAKILERLGEVMPYRTSQEISEKRFVINIFKDYRDSIDASTIANLLDSEDPYLCLQETVHEWYEDAVDVEENEILDRFFDDLELEDEDDEDEIRSTILESLEVELPIDDYLKEEVCVDIVVDTGDANYDYTLNAIYPHYGASSDDKIDNKASLVWLAKQQGYTKTQLKNALNADAFSGNKFLESVRQELLNHVSWISPLTFCVRMSLDKLLELSMAVAQVKRGYIVLDKSTVCGLYNKWDGGGSLLEIALDKDVKIPFRFIGNAYPDGKNYGYSIADCYGISSSLWRDTLLKTRITGKN